MKKISLDIEIEDHAIKVRMSDEVRAAYIETGPIQGTITDDGAFVFLAVEHSSGNLAMRVLEWALDWSDGAEKLDYTCVDMILEVYEHAIRVGLSGDARELFLKEGLAEGALVEEGTFLIHAVNGSPLDLEARVLDWAQKHGYIVGR